jgi:hypothetical protein
MPMPLNALLFQIRIFLFMGSGMLLFGSLTGLFVKNHILSAESASPFSIGDERTAAKPVFKRLKRNARRVKSDSILELKNDSGEFLPGSAMLHDISIRGACFDSPLLLKPGKRMEALLHSSKEGVLHISARIVWMKQRSHGILYGVEFDKVGPVRS